MGVGPRITFAEFESQSYDAADLSLCPYCRKIGIPLCIWLQMHAGASFDFNSAEPPSADMYLTVRELLKSLSMSTALHRGRDITFQAAAKASNRARHAFLSVLTNDN